MRWFVYDDPIECKGKVPVLRFCPATGKIMENLGCEGTCDRCAHLSILGTKYSHEDIISTLTNRAAKEKRFDLGVVIGRFQPLHKGHWALIEEARKECRNVLIIAGSANISGQGSENPLDDSERLAQFRTVGIHFDIAFMPDHQDDDTWANLVRVRVHSRFPDARGGRIAVYGGRDHPHANLFPEWAGKRVYFPSEGNVTTNRISGTEIRADWGEPGYCPYKDNRLCAPEVVERYLSKGDKKCNKCATKQSAMLKRERARSGESPMQPASWDERGGKWTIYPGTGKGWGGPCNECPPRCPHKRAACKGCLVEHCARAAEGRVL